MKKILLASCVRQKEEIFKLFIEGLDNLLIPDDVELHRLFLLHNCEHLDKYLDKRFNIIKKIKTDDEYRTDEQTHYWRMENLCNITNMKNGIFKFAQDLNFDYVFIVDSDLILQPETLVNLLNADKDIVSEIFWTRWKPNEPEMPNAWDYDHYSFFEGTLEKYKQKGLYECGGTGACILIKKSVIDRGVNFSPVTNISFWGEDRAFQIRSKVAGFNLYVDTNSPCFHIYRDSYIEDGQKFLDNIKK